MEKQRILETAAIIFTISAAAWVIREKIVENTAAVKKMEVALLTHIDRHNHEEVVADNDSKWGDAVIFLARLTQAFWKGLCISCVVVLC